MSNDALTIINDDNQPYLPLPLPNAEGTSFKVLKADEKQNRVVVKMRFGPNTRLPRHYHHCRAVAYTVSGEWDYDEGTFAAGHIAYEEIGHDHTPWSDKGAELFVVFDSDSGIFLDNHLEDGSILRIGMPFFKAYEGASLEAAAAIDTTQFTDILPAQHTGS